MGGLYRAVAGIVRGHDEDGEPVSEDVLVEKLAVRGGYPEEKVREAIDRLERDGAIYRPKGSDYYRPTNRPYR